MSQKVYIVGVGMTKFMRPNSNNPDYPELAKTAINRALIDAACNYSNVQACIAGYVFGDSTCGQKAVYEVGMTGVPVYNVNNNCATSSSALHLGRNLIAGGVYDCILCFGFEKMQTGALSKAFPDRADPLQKFIDRTLELSNTAKAPKAYIPYFFNNAGNEHMKLYGSKPEHFAMIAAKNHKHGVDNPYSQFRKDRSIADVMKSPKVNDLLTVLQCCPTSDGASAAIICNEATMKKLKKQNQAVEIMALQLTTDTPKMYENAREVIGYSMSKECARKAYKSAGIKPSEISTVELHDCFSVNELLTYQALGLCEEGQGHIYAEKGDNTYGGKCVVNPSGGLHAKGHPLGATGIAQAAELVWQLRNIAGKRQVPNCKYALQHNLGLGGACVVGIYKKYNNQKSGGTEDIKELEALEAKLKEQPLPKL